MNEAVMHFIWNNRLLKTGVWQTQTGERIWMESPGQQNPDAGPDFLGARLRIGNLRWTGAVEMSWHAMDWYRHRRQLDPTYNQVILHVVWEGGQHAMRCDGTEADTFVMKPWVDGHILDHYSQLMSNSGDFPCASQRGLVDRSRYLAMFDRGGLQRLLQHKEHFWRSLHQSGGDWDRALWVGLARSFGLNANSAAMEHLALSISMLEIKACRGHFDRFWAIINDRIKSSAAWIHLVRSRTIPVTKAENILKQLAVLVAYGIPDAGELLSASTPFEVRALFRKATQAAPGVHLIENTDDCLPPKTLQVFIINSLIPALFCYGEENHLPQEKDRAVQWLEQMGPEKNRYTDIFASLDVHADNALRSQGMIHQMNAFCRPRRCLECAVGAFLLTRTLYKRYAQTA
jgi:hypothetical protein